MTIHYFCIMSFNPETEEAVFIEPTVVEAKVHHLIVWNDDVNTFDWVIESLVDVCGHNKLQAEQCALLVHHKGKCGVKKGDFEDLQPQCEGLIDRGINATIDY